MRSLKLLQAYAGAADRVIREVPENDHVFVHEGKNLELYHFNGLSGLRAIVLAMILNDLDWPTSFMDFGCAYGRVLRYMRAAFPEISLTASDVRQDAIEYCEKTFEATPVLSSSDLEKITFPKTHDIIWMGSVITHFSSNDSKIIVDKMIENLNPGGLLLFSVHGRIYPLDVQPNKWEILNKKDFEAAYDEYRKVGYGYRDYPGRPGIGASLTKPSWMFEHIYENKDLIYSYYERAWTGWHDLVAIRKGPQRAYFSTYKDRPF
jgi:SAM-dependent methyltransferase